MSLKHQTGGCGPLLAPCSGLGAGRWLGASGWCELPGDPLSGVVQVARTGTALLAAVTALLAAVTC